MWGENRLVQIPNPAAGAIATITCPNAVTWELVSCKFTLTIDTTVATRYPYLTLDNAAGEFVFTAVAGYAATAPAMGTQVTVFSFVKGLSEWDAASTDYASGPMPTVHMFGGQKFAVRVDGIQAADTLTKIILGVVERPVDPAPREGEPYTTAAQPIY